MWSRRQFLSALGGVGSGLALGGWLTACRSGQGLRGRSQADLEYFDFSNELRQAHGIMSERLGTALAWSRHRQIQQLVFDSSERSHNTGARHWVVLSGSHGDDDFSVSICNPEPGELRAAAQRLAKKGAPRKAVRHAAIASQQAKPGHTNATPEPIEKLLASSQEHGGSRIVYRSSYLTRQTDEVQFISDERTLHDRTTRNRVGIVMSAWTGSTLATSSAEVANSSATQPHLDDAQISALAARTLSNLYARSGPDGDLEVLLTPDASASILLTLAEQACAPRGLLLPATPVLQIVDDPTVSGAFGSLGHDDAGDPSLPVPLVGEGGPKILAAGRRRRDQEAMLRVRPSHVVLKPGDDDWHGILSTIKNGVLMADAMYCGLDVDRHVLTLIAGRGREIHSGKFTGRVFGRLMMQSPLTDFLEQSRAVGSVPQTYAFSSKGIPSSAAAPHWLSQAKVEAL